MEQGWGTGAGGSSMGVESSWGTSGGAGNGWTDEGPGVDDERLWSGGAAGGRAAVGSSNERSPGVDGQGRTAVSSSRSSSGGAGGVVSGEGTVGETFRQSDSRTR